MRVLITGASGFIGSSLVEHLISAGNAPDIYLLKHASNFKLTHLHFPVVSLQDLRNIDIKFDVVIHLAQSPNYSRFPEEVREVFDTNVALTLELLEFSRRTGVKKFVYMSTSSVYKQSSDVLREESNLISDSLYAYTKISSENLINMYSKYFDAVIYRLFFPFGNEMGDKFLNRIRNMLIAGKPITIYSEKSFLFNPISITDVVEILRKTLLMNITGTINLAGHEIISFKEFVKIMSSILIIPPKYEISENAISINCIGSTEHLSSLMQHNFQPLAKSIENFATGRLL